MEIMIGTKMMTMRPMVSSSDALTSQYPGFVAQRESGQCERLAIV